MRKKSRPETREKCPLPNTHGRLEQAHRLWHQTLEQYDDPDGFRTNLNSTIETLRTVTFMLQGEKAIIPEFDTWYAQWQVSMKADPLVSWLAQARTTVVHRSDLETNSVAVATIHNNLSLARLTCEVPPGLPTPAIAAVLASSLPEPFKSNRTDLLLSLERRWCVKDLPDQELLEVLAHVYGVLSHLVGDAHKRLARDYETLDGAGNEHRTPDGRMPCMITTKEIRTARIRLEDGRSLTARSIPTTTDERQAKKATKRYGLKNLPAPSEGPADPLSLAESLLEMAKAMLKKDKHLERCIFLGKGTELELHNLKAGDRTEKYALMRTVADQVRKSQAEFLIDVGEAWTASVAEYEAGRMPEHAHDRKEIIWVSVVTKTGLIRSYETSFSRSLLGSIRLEETRVTDGPAAGYLTPILEVWGLSVPSESGSRGGPG